MSAEWAIFFLHADPVPDEYSGRSLKTYLKTCEEVFIGFVVQKKTVHIGTLPHVSRLSPRFPVSLEQEH